MLQPWATALVSGDKLVETRSFNTKHRGPLLIHASLGWTKECYMTLSRLQHDGFLPHNANAAKKKEDVGLPFGAIIGVVNLTETFQFGKDRSIEYIKGLSMDAVNKELSLGDWESGRWGWLCKDPVMFKTPIPAKGNLGIWNWEGELPELDSL